MPTTESLIGFEQAGIGSLLRQPSARSAKPARVRLNPTRVGQLFTDIARAVGENADHFLGHHRDDPKANWGP